MFADILVVSVLPVTHPSVIRGYTQPHIYEAGISIAVYRHLLFVYLAWSLAIATLPAVGHDSCRYLKILLRLDKGQSMTQPFVFDNGSMVDALILVEPRIVMYPVTYVHNLSVILPSKPQIH
jgi:hypothetical protein